MGILIGNGVVSIFRVNVYTFLRLINIKHVLMWLSGWKRAEVITFLLLVTLSVEHTPLPFRAQILPLTSILALAFLPVTVNKLELTSLFKVIMLFVAFVLIHSLFALLIDIVVLNVGDIRVLAWARQVIALGMGLAVFLVLRRTLISSSNRFVVYSIIVGAVPAILLAMLNILWYLTGNALAGDIVTVIRSALDYSFISPARVSGLSQEPAHFAQYLSIIVIPAASIAILTFKNRAFWFIVLCACIVSFIFTFSVTGFVVLMSAILSGILFGPRRELFVVLMIVLLGVTAVGLTLFDNNYAVIQVGRLFGVWSLSITSRFYGAFGPFMKSFSSYTLLGYGLGGTATHFTDVVPEFVQSDVASVHWEDMPNLGPLIGRLLAETGLLGLILFTAIIIVCFREISFVSRHASNQTEILFIKIIRIGIIAYCIGPGLFGPGSFALPYLWVWLAVVDARYQSCKKSLYKDSMVKGVLL